jgi:hypothetical protein
MTSAMTYESFSIICTLSERTIYLKLVETISFMCYEGTLEHAAFRVSIDLPAIHRIMLMAFASEKGSKVEISIQNANMKVHFESIIGGFLNINFHAILREKLIANDGQLTFSFTRMEEKQKKQAERIAHLEQHCERIAHLEQHCVRMFEVMDNCYIMICSKMLNSTCANSQLVGSEFVRIGIENLELGPSFVGTHTPNRFWSQFMPEQIEKLYKLKTVTIEGSTMGAIKLSKMAHPNVNRFILSSYSTAFTIENMPQFPALKSLELRGCTLSGGLDPAKLIKKYPELKNLSITLCTGINQTEVMTFCTSHIIALVFV